MPITVKVDSSLYDAETIESALYRNAVHFSGVLNTLESHIEVSLTVAPDSLLHDPQAIKHAFQTSLVDESLRRKIEDRTGDLRNLILAHAFSHVAFRENEDDRLNEDA